MRGGPSSGLIHLRPEKFERGLDCASHPLEPVAEWVAALRSTGQALAHGVQDGTLDRELRQVLSYRVILHWNRLGLSPKGEARGSGGAVVAYNDYGFKQSAVGPGVVYGAPIEIITYNRAADLQDELTAALANDETTTGKAPAWPGESEQLMDSAFRRAAQRLSAGTSRTRLRRCATSR